MYNNRKKLRALEFSLTMGCVLNCDYCPQGLLLSKYYEEDKNRTRYMTLDGFKKALEQVDRGGTISICGMSEPFSNPNCVDMILYAYEMGYSICFNTTLVGATKEDLERIQEITFENFILHIPDQESHSKFHVDAHYLELLDIVHATQQIDYYSCHGDVHEQVKEHIDNEKYAGIKLIDRAGNIQIEGVKSYHPKGKVICARGSEKRTGIWAPVMLPDGTLVLCCNDYGMKHVLGNLLESDWESIQAGEKFSTFINGLYDDSVDSLCRSCYAAKPLSKLPSVKLEEMLCSGGKTKQQKMIVEKFREAEEICVYGLGKYFKDHFFDELWNDAIMPTIFSDQNEELWGTQMNGVLCISPKELSKKKNVLIITFTLKSDDIVLELKANGISNIITYNEMLEVCNTF